MASVNKVILASLSPLWAVGIRSAIGAATLFLLAIGRGRLTVGKATGTRVAHGTVSAAVSPAVPAGASSMVSRVCTVMWSLV